MNIAKIQQLDTAEQNHTRTVYRIIGHGSIEYATLWCLCEKIWNSQTHEFLTPALRKLCDTHHVLRCQADARYNKLPPHTVWYKVESKELFAKDKAKHQY